jgi:hypothetical protein
VYLPRLATFSRLRWCGRADTVEGGLLELIGEFEECSGKIRIRCSFGEPAAVGRLFPKVQ